MPKSEEQLRQVLNYLDLDLRDIKHLPGYDDRKGSIYGVYDRENNRLLCSYSTLPQIKKWLKDKARGR